MEANLLTFLASLSLLARLAYATKICRKEVAAVVDANRRGRIAIKGFE
jgi:hypothetical protein